MSISLDSIYLIFLDNHLFLDNRHRFLVDIDTGVKVFQAVDITSGKPVVTGWKTGKLVQRSHFVKEIDADIIVVRLRLCNTIP